MNWIQHLEGRTVAVDSAPLIYFVEHHPDFFLTNDVRLGRLRQPEILVLADLPD